MRRFKGGDCVLLISKKHTFYGEKFIVRRDDKRGRDSSKHIIYVHNKKRGNCTFYRFRLTLVQKPKTIKRGGNVIKDILKLGIALYVAKRWGLENEVTVALTGKIKDWAKTVAGK